jgi:hypothetical protein
MRPKPTAAGTLAAFSSEGAKWLYGKVAAAVSAEKSAVDNRVATVVHSQLTLAIEALSFVHGNSDAGRDRAFEIVGTAINDAIETMYARKRAGIVACESVRNRAENAHVFAAHSADEADIIKAVAGSVDDFAKETRAIRESMAPDNGKDGEK